MEQQRFRTDSHQASLKLQYKQAKSTSEAERNYSDQF
jgi:hypothetical protein